MLFGSGLLALALAFAPRSAQASACCLSATAIGGGVGRLVFWENFAVGLRMGAAGNFGRWAPDGSYLARSDDSRTTRVNSQLWGIVAIVPQKLSVSLSVPIIYSAHREGQLREQGAGLGDINLGLRHDIRTKSKAAIPAFAVLVSTTAPSGRSPARADSPLGADITGRGSWFFNAGVQLEWAPSPWFIRLDAGGGIAPTHNLPSGLQRRYGPSAQAALSGGIQAVEGLVFSGYLRANYEGRVTLDGLRIPESNGHELGAGVGASWQVAEHWSLQAAIDVPLATHHGGHNRDVDLSGSLGIRYGFWRD